MTSRSWPPGPGPGPASVAVPIHGFGVQDNDPAEFGEAAEA